MTQPLEKPKSSPYYMEAPSFKGRMWKMPAYDRALATRMAQAYGLPEMVAALLVNRGIGFEGVEGFLSPNIKTHFPDPMKLTAMREAASDMAAAIIAGQVVGILADFDVDGATSAGILTRFLKSVGQAHVPLYIPDRLSEGYGPNNKAFETLKGEGCTWVIVADSGTTAFSQLQYATDIELKTIVLDHHEAEEVLPAATYVVNPKRRDDTSGYTMLAACGMSFLFCVAVNSVLRAQGFYANRAEPDLRQWLDLVALGTICDMVPMTGPNRLLVRAGFAKMTARENVGIDALLTVGKITAVPDPSHAGFVIGPRINAGSRVHQSDLGAKLLATDDPEEAMRLAWLLDDCNIKRRAMQKEINAHAAARVKAYGYENDPVIVLDDAEWHPGLVGLVAGDIKEKFGKPACVIGYATAEDGTYEGRGSGRSVTGINIAESFIAARAEGILVKGGGHAMAGGFTVLPDRIKDFREFMKAHIGAQAALMPAFTVMDVDAVMSARSLSVDMAKLVGGAVAPYGAGHPEPNFILSDVIVLNADVVGASHVRVTVRDRDGGPSVKAVAFRAVDTPLGTYLLKEAKNAAVPLHLLGTAQLNVWQGRESAEFHIADGFVGFV